MTRGVVCPDCGSIRTPTRNSGLDVEHTRVRYRHCEDCQAYFTTAEIVVPGLSFHRTRPTPEGRVARRTPEYVSVRRNQSSVTVSVVPSTDRNRCRKGLHELTDDNVFLHPNGSRMCRACRNENARERYHHARRNAPPSILEEQRAYWREQKRRAA